MPNFAVIDLGSNSVRLCVYEVKDDHKQRYLKKDFKTLLNNKVMAGLSAYVENGIFTELGISHAVNVLNGHNKRLKYFNCKRCDIFATAVLRNANNSDDAIARIEKETGFSITILSEQSEAHLGFIGASSDQYLENGTLIDIGGGSSELTRIKKGQDVDSASIAMGSLSAYTKLVNAILPTKKEMNEIYRLFLRKIEKLESPERYETGKLYAIGGSIRAAAKVNAEILSLDKRPETLSLTDIDQLIKCGSNTPDAFAHFCLKACPERIHTLLPGCLIARAFMEKCRVDKLTICKNGLREGYLIERMLLDKQRKAKV